MKFFHNKEAKLTPLTIVTLHLSLLLYISTNSYGQEEINKIPELNGHVFVPNTYIVDPFMNSTFHLGVGFGSTGEYKYPIFDVDDKDIYGISGQLIFVTVALGYQQKIQDWVALYVNLSLAARVGTNIGSILAEGFSSINSFNLGWKIRLLERDKVKLSTLFGISNYNGTFLSISKFIEDIIDNQPYPSLVTNTPALNGNLGFQFAYGISELFGIKMNYLNSVGESLERGETAYYFSFGTGIDLNFYQKNDVPIGFSLAYLLSSRPEQIFRESGLSNGLNFKIAYTGTDDFVLGLQTYYTKLPVSQDRGNFNTFGFAFSLNYYFN
jgi:hypothetical protein